MPDCEYRRERFGIMPLGSLFSAGYQTRHVRIKMRPKHFEVLNFTGLANPVDSNG